EGGNAGTGLAAPPRHGRMAGGGRSGIARGSGGGHWRCIGVIHWRTRLAPEQPVEEVVICIGPVPIFVAIWPERVVKDVGISVRPEDRSEPGYKACSVMMPPRVARG